MNADHDALFDPPPPMTEAWWETPSRYSFEPEKDITAYELAFVLQTLQVFCDKGIFDRLPVEVARHFKPVSR